MTENTSLNMRKNPLFMRNEFIGDGKWNIPTRFKQAIALDNLSLVACSDTKYNDLEANTQKGVHFFVDDYRFKGIYQNPEKTLTKYSQYKFVLTPDFSLYADMPMWKQLENVCKNRWCGAYWQNQGLTVIPTISWSTPKSYAFCFDGVEIGSVVGIGMIGCKQEKTAFLNGYNEMLRIINPQKIICFGKPFEEMHGDIIIVDYMSSRKVVR